MPACVRSGEVVQEETLVCLRKVQVIVEGKEETAISVTWVTEGMDRCRVGFLGCHMVVPAVHHNGALAQLMKVFSQDPGHCNTAERHLHHKNHGCPLATTVSCMPVANQGKIADRNVGVDNEEKKEREMEKKRK